LRRFVRFVWVVLAYDVLVVLWGAYVRASFSGDGCGSHWPLCNGEMVPHLAQTKTIVELSHRVSSGGSLVLAVVIFIWARKLYELGDPARRGAALVLVFTASEALIGAALVLLRLVAHDVSLRRAVSTSMHLSNTFLLLASLVLTARAAEGRPLPPLRGRGWAGALVLGALASVILVGATGALAALGDTLYPSHSVAQGLAADVAPSAPLLIRLRSLHPFIAVGSGALVISIATIARARWLSVAFFAQLALGLLNVTLLAPTWLQLLHLLSADVVWVLLVLVALDVARPISASRGEAPEEFRPAP
jgi:cytochrome c oxidase assembly protein subunit 15